MTVAEYFRDGRDVVLIADSTSRWAEALREFASRQRRASGRGGLPGKPAGRGSPVLRTRRPGADARRSGRIGHRHRCGLATGRRLHRAGVRDTQRFVRTVWTLDRDLVYARHYPAVTWRSSFLTVTPMTSPPGMSPTLIPGAEHSSAAVRDPRRGGPPSAHRRPGRHQRASRSRARDPAHRSSHPEQPGSKAH